MQIRTPHRELNLPAATQLNRSPEILPSFLRQRKPVARSEHRLQWTPPRHIRPRRRLRKRKSKHPVHPEKRNAERILPPSRRSLVLQRRRRRRDNLVRPRLRHQNHAAVHSSQRSLKLRRRIAHPRRAEPPLPVRAPAGYAVSPPTVGSRRTARKPAAPVAPAEPSASLSTKPPAPTRRQHRRHGETPGRAQPPPVTLETQRRCQRHGARQPAEKALKAPCDPPHSVKFAAT